MFFAFNYVFYQEILKNYGIEVWSRFLEIINAPLNFKEMLWILVPLIATTLLIEFYFGIYVDEELGWNTAFTNTLVLMFVSLDLGRHLYQSGFLFFDKIKTVIVITVLIEAVLLAIFDFFHILPERFAFKMSSHLPINFIAISAIILVYTNIQVNLITVSALVLLAVFMALAVGFIHSLEPKIRHKLY